jgi:hypothetical protein
MGGKKKWGPLNKSVHIQAERLLLYYVQVGFLTNSLRYINKSEYKGDYNYSYLPDLFKGVVYEAR